MSIENTDVVDFIGIDKDTSEVVLSVSDHLLWGDDSKEHMYLLQEKINAYLRYIESGEIYEDNPDTENKDIIISVVGKYPLNEEAECFFSKASNAIEETGFSLRFELLKEE